MTLYDLGIYAACIVLIPPIFTWAVMYVAGGVSREIGNALAIAMLLEIYGLVNQRHARLISIRSDRGSRVGSRSC